MRKISTLAKLNRGNFQSNVVFLKQCGLLRKKSKILEIGSGRGAMAAYLGNLGFKITGTEVNAFYIKFAKRKFDLNLTKINSETLPFKRNSFDVVISFDVLEHIPNTTQHLLEVYRVLKTGGIYLFATPNKYTNIPFSIIKDKNLTTWKKYHCSLHSYWALKRVLERNLFTATFLDVPVVNDFFRHKMRNILGGLGDLLLNLVSPDKLPLFLRTNFYVIAKKRN